MLIANLDPHPKPEWISNSYWKWGQPVLLVVNAISLVRDWVDVFVIYTLFKYCHLMLKICIPQPD